MKRLFLLLLSSFLFSAAFSQKRHSPFIGVGVGFTPAQDLSYSAEVGTWGITSPTSFSATFDAVRNVDKGSDFSYWLGIKPYFTVGEKEKLVYMMYFAPKVQINGNKNLMIETGFNPNYILGKRLLLGVTVGNQTLRESPWNLFVSAGLVFLAR